MNNPIATDPAFLDSIISNIRAQIHEHDPKLDTALEAILSLVLGRAVGQY